MIACPWPHPNLQQKRITTVKVKETAENIRWAACNFINATTMPGLAFNSGSATSTTATYRFPLNGATAQTEKLNNGFIYEGDFQFGDRNISNYRL